MSHLEETLAFQLQAAGLIFVREFRALPDRQFRFDFAFPGDARLLVEVQGGTFARGKMGHTSGMGVHRDCEKNNLAVLAGWRVLAVAEHHISSGLALRWVQEALFGRDGPDDCAA